jgi:hypothetical protein
MDRTYPLNFRQISISKALSQGCQIVFFQTKNPYLEGLGMENFAMFYGHLEYLTALWYTLWPIGTFCGHLVCFSHFVNLVLRKIWQPWLTSVRLVILF